MNENLPHSELSARVARGDLARAIEFAREISELRLGHEIELALLEPVERDGHLNMRAYWRRKQNQRAKAA